MKVYSIYDKVAKKFNQPFLAENNEVAIRSFLNGVKDSPFAQDFELYCVGDFVADDYKHPFVSCDSDYVCNFVSEAVNV